LDLYSPHLFKRLRRCRQFIHGGNPAMKERADVPFLLGETLLAAIREAVREEIHAAGFQKGFEDGDRLLDAEEASKVLSVSQDWLYRNAKKLPFARKLGPKMLRFSSVGIQKYLATRRFA
jgi:predicted DNA-binding transcriptional regulator AlpA